MKQEELNKKAEEAAREVYTYTFQGMDDLIGLFLAGYKLAEEDLALTWEDIRTITKILEEVTEEVIPVEFYNGDAISCYKEVLRKFKEEKK